MPIYDSPHWDNITGSCLKHGIPTTPCPQCMATSDPDVSIHFTQEDSFVLDSGVVKNATDLLPEGFQLQGHLTTGGLL